MSLKRFSLGVTILLVMLATFSGVSASLVSAATVCTPTRTVSGPFAQDGAGDLCFQTTNLCTYINSWNLSTLEVNGTSYLNTYVFSNTIAPVSGNYIIHYVSTVAWGHFEFGGTCSGGPSATPTRTPTPTKTPGGPTATPTHSSPAAHAAAPPVTTSTPVRFLVSKQDGVDQRVGALGRLDGARQRLFAAHVHAIGKDYERFASRLILHQFVRRQIDGIIK